MILDLFFGVVLVIAIGICIYFILDVIISNKIKNKNIIKTKPRIYIMPCPFCKEDIEIEVSNNEGN
jgi:hypothetical protein